MRVALRERKAPMKKTEKAALAEGLRKLSADLVQIADVLEGKDPPEKEAVATQEDVRQYSFEEVRGLLADKSRAGHRAEVKALLTAHGVSRLSEITDPAVLTQVWKEAEEIGNG